MPYTGNPSSNIVDRLRLEVGDIDELDEGLSDEVYRYIIIKNGDDITGDISSNSIIQSLRYLVSKYANCVHEEAGDLEVWDTRHKQYSEMLDRYLKDPRMGIIGGHTPYAGGISNSDIEDNTNNLDANRSFPEEDWFKVKIPTTLRL